MPSIKLDTKFDDESHETGEIHVQVKLNGEILPFILDTACAKTTLCFNESSKKFKKVGTSTSSGVFGSYSFDLIKVERLELGSFILRNLTLARSLEEHSSQNLLGMDILKDYNLIFNFPENRLEVNNKDVVIQSPESLTLDDGNIPYIPVKCGEKDISAVWDSGAGISLVDLNFIEKNKSLFQEVAHEIGTDSGGSKFSTPVFIMNSIQIAGCQFKPHKVAGVPLSVINKSVKIPMQMILGFGAFQQAKWWFDFPRKQWKVKLV